MLTNPNGIQTTESRVISYYYISPMSLISSSELKSYAHSALIKHVILFVTREKLQNQILENVRNEHNQSSVWKVSCLLEYSGWTMTMDFAMDQCLQSDARQSHSLGSDWIVK